MFIPPNGNMLNFNFCNFKCIVASMLQSTIEFPLIIIYLIVGQMSIIEVDLLTMTFLSMDKPNKEWIVIPLTNNAPFPIYVAI